MYYGNFWNDSGEELARRYLSGEIPRPQAVICTNDFMAFGLCDGLSEAGVDIPGELTVTGYDLTGGDHTAGRNTRQSAMTERTVKAGITGNAQVVGKYNTTPYDKLKLDLMYIEKYTLAKDILLILKTVKIIFMPEESTEGIKEGYITPLQKGEDAQSKEGNDNNGNIQ